MASGYQPSEGTFIYLLGLVIVATCSDRFWLGFTLAVAPILIGALADAISAASGR